MTDRKIKICGISEPFSFAAAMEHGADYIGFVFCRDSPRYIALDEAVKIVRGYHGTGKAKIVAVTMWPSNEEILAYGKIADYLQLHGDETSKRTAEIKELFPQIKIIKVIKIVDLYSAKLALDGIKTSRDIDMIILDAENSGSGHRFDWEIVKKLGQIEKPWLLAGGINQQNLIEAADATGATGFDISSGVETARGVKSVQKIIDLLHYFYL